MPSPARKKPSFRAGASPAANLLEPDTLKSPDRTVALSPDDHGAYIVPRSVFRLPEHHRQYVDDLQHLVRLRQVQLLQIDRLVFEMRREGLSWGVIGWAVGTTPEAARQRWAAVK